MQNVNKLAVLVTLLFITQVAMGASSAPTISKHTINIQINPAGVDTVVEKFYLTFQDEQAKIDFRQKASSLGTILEEWQKLNPIFTPSLGANASNKKITYTEDPENYLQISYDLMEPLMAKGKDATMMTEYVLKTDYFSSFYKSNLWVIPDNTTISIELPPGAEIRDAVKPEAAITNGPRQIVTWAGYKSGTALALNYVLWKSIGPVIDISAITAFLFKTQEGLILIIIAIVILAALVWQRKKISRRIEEFVEKNSEIQEE